MQRWIPIIIGMGISDIGWALMIIGFVILVKFIFKKIKNVPMDDITVTKYDRLTNIDDKAFEFGNENEQPKNRWFKGIYMHKTWYSKATYEDYKKFGGGFEFILLSMIFINLGFAVIKSSAVITGAIWVGLVSVGMIALMNEGKKSKQKKMELNIIIN